MKLRTIQPRAGEILDVVSESPCVEIKVVERDGVLRSLKFIFENGAVLYAPLPSLHQQRMIDLAVSAGAMTA
jgi:hypothetical protein